LEDPAVPLLVRLPVRWQPVCRGSGETRWLGSLQCFQWVNDLRPRT